jgi:hypothetical protein
MIFSQAALVVEDVFTKQVDRFQKQNIPFNLLEELYFIQILFFELNSPDWIEKQQHILPKLLAN